MQTLQSADAKLDYALQSNGRSCVASILLLHLLLLFLALVISIVLGVWAGDKADTQEPSFLLLSKQAEKAKQRSSQKNKRDWSLFALSLVTSIVTGVIGNTLFAISLQRWLSR
jgi:hypothetical protein